MQLLPASFNYSDSRALLKPQFNPLISCHNTSLTHLHVVLNLGHASLKSNLLHKACKTQNEAASPSFLGAAGFEGQTATAQSSFLAVLKLHQLCGG